MQIRRFDGKVAVVTGGSIGIGRAIVLRLAGEGAKVAFIDILEDAAQKVLGEIEAAGSEGYFEKVDIKDTEKVCRFAKNVEAKFGKIDVLVNSVGGETQGPKPFVSLTETEIDNTIAVNLKGHVMITQAIVPGMTKQKYGKIVTISSVIGHTGMADVAIYCACKAGIFGLSKTWARELAKYNINVNVVCPGPTLTEGLQQLKKANPEVYEAIRAGVPMGRMAEPEDIASGVAYLASDDASFITGQTLDINGGFVMP
ncbi:MAG: 3-oxoacyl-ACP reductase family protein [Dehalococcoidia bacterium]